jgi:Protein of unknown function (DUF1449)
MNELLLISASFPTAIFTVFLLISVIYWITAMFGFVDLDVLDIDVPEADGHMSLNAQAEHGFAESVSGLLMKLGLNGVPLTIVITFIALIGWAISSLLSRYLGEIFGYGWVHYLTGVPIFLGSLYIAVLTTAQIIKPLRVFFSRIDQNVQKKVLGQTAIVRSSRVDNDFGEAFLDDGGAGLILKVRTRGEDIFSHGDKVVLLDYDANTNSYKVISETEFLGERND